MTGTGSSDPGAQPSVPGASRAPGAVTIGPFTEDDLPLIVAVHRSAFPASILTRLGPDVVRLHYESLWSGAHDVMGLIARAADGEAVGFLVGGVFRGSSVRFVAANRWRLARALLVRPQILLSRVAFARVRLGLGLLAAARRPHGPERPSRVPARSFGVLVLAVEPGAQGAGVGQQLLADVATRARADGFESIHLTTYPGSESARFYAAHGWTRIHEPDGSWEGLMIRSLTDQPGDTCDAEVIVGPEP